MLLNVLTILILAALAALFFFLASRAWRSRRAYIRFPGVILSGLLGLVVLAITAVVLLGFYRLNKAPYTYSETNIPVTGSPNPERGARLASFCAGCHSTTGKPPLDGSGENFLEGPGAPPVGLLYAPDLTPSGRVKDWTDQQIARAIREGVDNKGRPLVIMPSAAFHSMSDEDVMSIVAYLRSMPPSGRNVPDRNLNALAAVFFGSGMFPTSAQEPINQPVETPARGTVEYGEYVAKISACGDCHGPTLSGEAVATGPGGGPNLRERIKNYSSPDQFVHFFTTGETPDGRAISPDSMPWAEYRPAYEDDELVDLYNYLKGLSGVTERN